MKSLILLLLVLGVYSDCASDEFRIGTACIPCEESPCATCKGTNRCDTCPDGIINSNYGQCDKCKSPDSMPINKECVVCTTLGPDVVADNGEDCLCSGTSDCCKAKGIYGWTEDSKYYCSACSYDVVGCTECSYSQIPDKFVCTKCEEGYEKEGEDDKAVCVSYSGHLFAIAGLLISLLTLF